MSGLVTLLPFVLIFVVMYFLMVRPQQKRSQEQRRLISSLEPGDEVVTIGGVFGDIVELEDAEVILEVYDGTQVKFLRSAIARKVVPEDAVHEIDEVDDDDLDDGPRARLLRRRLRGRGRRDRGLAQGQRRGEQRDEGEDQVQVRGQRRLTGDRAGGRPG